MTAESSYGDFTCANCQRTFEREWSPEEAEAELREKFPDTPREECVEICDDCWREGVSLGIIPCELS